MRILIFSIILLTSLAGCRQNDLQDPIPTDRGYDYMPLDLGKSWTYQLDSIVFDPEPAGILVDTVSGQVRMTVADTFRDVADRLVYRIERSTRASDTASWEVRDVWSFVREEFRFVWTEENLPFIKLIFPPQLDRTWDGNALIDVDEVRIQVRGESLDFFKFWGDYRISNIRDSLEILGNTYRDVITVDQVDREVLIEKRYSQEQYAKNVGLVFKRLEILDTQNLDTSLPFEQRAEKGYIMEMKLIDHR